MQELEVKQQTFLKKQFSKGKLVKEQKINTIKQKTVGFVEKKSK